MKQIFINKEKLETQVALLNRGQLEEYELERTNKQVISGGIFRGVVKNLENSLQAAFIDIGLPKNAFLHYWDIDFSNNLDKYDDEQEERDFVQSQENYSNIDKLLPVGKEIIVQVTKGPIGTKGPRVTTRISIAGQFLVFVLNSKSVSVSKRISDSREKARLKKIMSKFSLPENVGLICRTSGARKKEEFFWNDLEMLLEEWGKVQEKLKNSSYTCLYRPPDLVKRSVSFLLTEENINEIIVDNSETYQVIKKQILRFSDISLNKLKLFRGSQHIFDEFNISPQIESIHEREVKLKSGGYLCIDETEALIAIDINSGKSTLGKDHPETILNTNIEAALEIAKQLRLRDIGGLIVIDFIDMRSRRDQDAVYKKFKDELDKDRVKTKVLRISPLGLLEMTRQREHESLKDSTFSKCPYCRGRGVIKSVNSINVEIQREVLKVLRSNPKVKEIKILINPQVLERLKKKNSNLFDDLEEKYKIILQFRSEKSLHIEDFRLINPSTDEQFN